MADSLVQIIRATIYLRISDLRETDLEDYKDTELWEKAIELYFAQREQQLREFAQRISTPEKKWVIANVIRENDVIRKIKGGKIRNASAHRKRKMTLPDGSVIERVWRPGFQELLRSFREGTSNGLLTENLNRVLRDPRDGIDFRDIAQPNNVNARSMAGTLTLTDGGTRSERMMLGIMCEVAADFSENLAWSVAQGRERKSRAREWAGGQRRFGFETDGQTPIQAEYDVVEEMSLRVIMDSKLRKNGRGKSPHSLGQMARELNERGVATVTGVPWTPEILKSILLRERNAGIWVFRGKEDGKAPWPAIIPVHIFRRVVKILTNEDRSTRPGGQPAKWLGSGVYLCGKCGDGTTVEVHHKAPRGYKRKDGTRSPVDHLPKVPKYKCVKYAHLNRDMAGVDKVVTDWVVDRLTQPDLIELFRVPIPELEPVDTDALEAEKLTLEANLKAMAVEKVKGEIGPDEYREARAYVVNRLAEIERDLNRDVQMPSHIETLVKSVNVRATWESYSLATKQAIIRRLAKVRIVETTKRGRTFDPDSVVIEPVNWEELLDQAA